MRQIPISEVQIGVTLAQPVVDDRGRVLLKTGCVLTATMIACLERWTIGTVEIEDGTHEAAEPPSSGDPPLSLSERWSVLFEDRDSEEMQTIHRALSKWLSSRQNLVAEETP